MKKMIFLMLVFFLGITASMNAQVNIGSSADPTPGTVLDLSQTGSKNLGLRLPVVSLIGSTPFQLTDGGDGSAAAGTIVYNDGLGALSEAGIYVWDGSQWLAGTSGTVTPPPACLSAPAVPTGITFSKATGIKLSEQITATATPEVTSGDAIPTQYNWTIPAAYFDIIGSTTSRTITLQAKAAASSITTTIKVNAENTCGTSADYDNPTVVSILNCSAGPAQPGITGKDGSSGNEVTANETSLIYSVTSPVAGETYTWSSTDFILPEIKTGTSITVTAPAAAGPATIIVTPSNDCSPGPAKTLSVNVTAAPSYPVVIDTDVRTGFISGAYTSMPTTAKSGKLLIAAEDGNSGLTIQWNDISNYPASGTSYVNTDASKFVGANAGCEAGWRLPSIVELKAIADYFKSTYGSYQGPTSAQVPGFTQMQGTLYWSSTYYGPNNPSSGYAWYLIISDSYPYRTNSGSSMPVRCVKDLE